MYYRTRVMGDRSFKLRHYRDFRLFCSRDLDLNPVTFMYELNLYSLEIHRLCKYELPTSMLSKLLSDSDSDRQTDRHEGLPHCFVGGQFDGIANFPRFVCVCILCVFVLHCIVVVSL